MRCSEFWDKWEKEPNFCGLSAQSISEINGYLELRDKVVKMGVTKAVFYENCPSGACRPALRLSDDKTRTDATNYIISMLKRGEKVTQANLKDFVDQKLKKSDTCKTPSKIDEKSTQMRTDVKPPKSSATFPEKVPPAEVTIPIPSDPAKPPQPSLAQQERAREIAAAGTNQPHVHPGSKVTLNPVIINDTLRESPFKTAAQVKAHDADPLGIDAPAELRPAPVDPVKAAREEMEARAQAFIDVAPRQFQLAVTDMLRNHTSWKVKDILCFGIDAMVEKEPKFGRRA
jgi:hypothetical protein